MNRSERRTGMIKNMRENTGKNRSGKMSNKIYDKKSKKTEDRIVGKIKIGLLPMYIKLYDDIWPELRIRMEAFLEKIKGGFRIRGIEIIDVPLCRLKGEFDAAVRMCEKEKADAMVTLHLAYSPSLESAASLAETELPIVVLDTTETFDFSPMQDESEILYNHGIHGVQDMCSMLVRNGRQFFVEAGHWQESDVIDRIVCRLKGIKIASNMKKSRVGIIGSPFEGMGDFYIPAEKLRRDIGIDTIKFDAGKAMKFQDSIKDEEIMAEISDDLASFDISGNTASADAGTGGADTGTAAGTGGTGAGAGASTDADADGFSSAHRNSALAGLAVRKWIQAEGLSAVTINFMDISKSSGLCCMPFLEISKAMAGGTGYAGEGDLLTASLTGAIASVHRETSFTEMFCPDWKNNSMFLSHMGEMNLNLAAGKPVLMKKEFPFTDASDTVVAYGAFKAGEAVIVNLAPAGVGSVERSGTTSGYRYSLIIAGGRMLGASDRDNMPHSIRGWFKPDMPVAEFLEKFSYAGGTHHSALVYCLSNIGISGIKRELVTFGMIMGWRITDIC